MDDNEKREAVLHLHRMMQRDDTEREAQAWNADIHQEEIQNADHPPIQGHADLFCPSHIVRFWNRDTFNLHQHHMHPPTGPPSNDSVPMYEPTHALNCITQHSFNLSGYDFMCFRSLIDCVQQRIHSLFHTEIANRRGVKASIRTYIEFERIEPSEYLDNIIYAWFSNLEGERGSEGVMKILLHESEIMPFVNETISSVEDRVGKFVKTTSGLRVRRVINLDIVLIDYNPITGGTYQPTPWLLSRYKPQHIINVNNTEEAASDSATKEFDMNACFFWAVLAAERVAKRVERGKQYKNRKKKTLQESMRTYRVNLKKIAGLNEFSLPMTLDQVPKFERLNRLYRMTVLGFENKYDQKKWQPSKFKGDVRKERKEAQKMIKDCIYPLYVSKNNNPNAISITLLLVEDCDGYGHYIAVKDVSKLLAQEGQNKYYCQHCLQTFQTAENRDTHMRFCATLGLQIPILPSGEDAKLKFREYRKMIPAPYKIFSDFEARLVNIDFPHTTAKLGKVPNHHEYIYRETQTGGKTRYLQKHIMIGYAYVCLNSQNEIICHKAYVASSDDEDVAETFLKDIQELAIRLRNILRERQAESYRIMNNAPTKVSDDLIRQQRDCYFCNEPLLLSTDLKFPSVKSGPEYDRQIKLWYEKHAVRHHSHETFEYIALAHNYCNLRAVANLNIPVYFHNMGGYDGHALIMGLSKLDGNASVVPSTG